VGFGSVLRIIRFGTAALMKLKSDSLKLRQLAFMGIGSGSGKVFGWFANMTSVAGLITWFAISVTYIRFHQGLMRQGYDRSTLPFASKLQPYAAYYSAFMCMLICIVSGDRFTFVNALSVFRLECVPQRPMGSGHVRHQLPPLGPFPHHVLLGEVCLQDTLGVAGRDGLCQRHQGDRGGYLRRCSAQEQD
jgi:hypothetical protein